MSALTAARRGSPAALRRPSRRIGVLAEGEFVHPIRRWEGVLAEGELVHPIRRGEVVLAEGELVHPRRDSGRSWPGEVVGHLQAAPHATVNLRAKHFVIDRSSVRR